MTHLDMDTLLALRESGAEPGDAAARQHLAECTECGEALRGVDQRVARLKALPALRPSRDRWPAVRARLAEHHAARRRRQAIWSALGGLAVAASFGGAFLLGSAREEPVPVAAVSLDGELQDMKARSQALEAALHEYQPSMRVTDGRTDRVAQDIENRIAELDRRLDLTELAEQEARDAQLLRLWRERVGLLDALVDVHVTRASHVGL